MRKSAKTPKHSTVKEKPAKNCGFEEYYNTLAYQMAPTNKDHRKRVAIQLTEWAKDLTEPYTLEDFWNMIGISEGTYYTWKKDCYELKEAHEYAMRKLASMRERGATMKVYDASFVKLSLPHYSKRWKEMEEWRAKLNSKEQVAQEASNFNIYLEDIPKSKDAL